MKLIRRFHSGELSRGIRGAHWGVTFVLALSLVACSTVTIAPRGAITYSTLPTYEDSKAFFLGGLIGEHHINVKDVCGGRVPLQMQTQATILDGFLTVITLAIYAPRTAKVWCGMDISNPGPTVTPAPKAPAAPSPTPATGT